MPVSAVALRICFGIVVQIIQQYVVVRSFAYRIPFGGGALIVCAQRVAATVEGVKLYRIHAGSYHHLL